MRKKAYVPIVLIIILSITAYMFIKQTDYKKTKGAIIEYRDTTHHFGNVNSGDTVKYSFAFKNVGDSSLIIKDVSSSCGCTIPKWTTNPIFPGENGNIDVTFSKENEIGLVKRLVIVKANTIPEYTLLKIEANLIK